MYLNVWQHCQGHYSPHTQHMIEVNGILYHPAMLMTYYKAGWYFQHIDVFIILLRGVIIVVRSIASLWLTVMHVLDHHKMPPSLV